MNFDAKIFALFAILSIAIFEEHSVLGDCWNTKSPHAACLWADANGKCPHGMLRLDTDDWTYKDGGDKEIVKKDCFGAYRSIEVTYTSKDKKTRTSLQKACCLLTTYSRVDVKIKGSPCTGGTCKKTFQN